MALLRAAAAAAVITLASGSASAQMSPECFEYGVDFYGYDLLVLSEVDSHAKCMKSCEDEETCQYWSYDTQTSTCFLKSAAAILGRVERENIISGPKTCLVDTSCFETGYDYVGFDLMRIDGQGIPSAVECQRICVLDPHCAFFSYKASVQGCYLKTTGALVGRVADADVTSGPRVCAVREEPKGPSFLPNQGCAEGSVEYKGHDVHVTTSVRTAPHCQMLCAANTMCFNWTWDRDTMTCYEKDAAAPDSRQSGPHTLGKVSGSKTCIPTNPGCQHLDMTFQGKLIKEIRNSTFDACQANCQTERECAYWSWNSTRKICQMRQATPFGYVESIGTIAGPKFCPNNDLCIEQADYVGYDIEAVQDGSVSSAADCRILCQKKDGCEYWTWVITGNCYLKSGEALKGKTNSVSSVSRYSGPRECHMSYGCYNTNVAYLGRDAHQVKNVATYMLCEQLCANQSCQTWTYITNSKVCLLTENNAPLVPYDGAISGSKDCKPDRLSNCFRPGVKYDATEVKFDSSVTTATECQTLCAKHRTCETFSFDSTAGCYLYELTDEQLKRYKTKYPTVVSGPAYCKDAFPGRTRTLTAAASSRTECKDQCTSPDCVWYDYDGTSCSITMKVTQPRAVTTDGYRYEGEVSESTVVDSSDLCRAHCDSQGATYWNFYKDTNTCEIFGTDEPVHLTRDMHAISGTAEDPLVYPFIFTSNWSTPGSTPGDCATTCNISCRAWGLDTDGTCYVAPYQIDKLKAKEGAMTRFNLAFHLLQV